MDAETAYVGAPPLDLSSVDTRSNLQVEKGELVADLLRSPDRSSGAIEECERTVTGRLDDASTSEFDVASADAVVLVEQLAAGGRRRPSHAPSNRRCP